ncbi:hypothetical protein ACFVUS_05610 [Nocardia sp. NPDC058058]|uniref:hypothetical protein n=1 Tax=Nocardia sp. NPDC058058 TaxID=3346317 RepID=UPI0036DD7D45
MQAEDIPHTFGPALQFMVNGREVADVTELSERDYLRLFTKRPGIYIGYESVRGVVGFLNGYDFAVRHRGDAGLHGFREWLLANHVHHASSLAWWVLIERIALPDRDFDAERTPEQEARLVASIFELLDAFLADRETSA